MKVPLQLPNGHSYVIREIRPDDKQALAAGLQRLSPESVYRRFLSPKPCFTKGELRYLTEVDGRDHYALVVLPADRPDIIVGAARFVRLREDPEAAEAAIVIGDPLQGMGLGRRLAQLLGDAAVERGIRRFTADVQSQNVPALKLMRTLSERVVESPSAGVTHLESQLAA